LPSKKPKLIGCARGAARSVSERPARAPCYGRHAQLIDRTVKLLWQHSGMSAMPPGGDRRVWRRRAFIVLGHRPLFFCRASRAQRIRSVLNG